MSPATSAGLQGLRGGGGSAGAFAIGRRMEAAPKTKTARKMHKKAASSAMRFMDELPPRSRARRTGHPTKKPGRKAARSCKMNGLHGHGISGGYACREIPLHLDLGRPRLVA